MDGQGDHGNHQLQRNIDKILVIKTMDESKD